MILAETDRCFRHFLAHDRCPTDDNFRFLKQMAIVLRESLKTKLSKNGENEKMPLKVNLCAPIGQQIMFVAVARPCTNSHDQWTPLVNHQCK